MVGTLKVCCQPQRAWKGSGSVRLLGPLCTSLACPATPLPCTWGVRSGTTAPPGRVSQPTGRIPTRALVLCVAYAPNCAAIPCTTEVAVSAQVGVPLRRCKLAVIPVLCVLCMLQALDVLAVPSTPQPLLLAATKPMQVVQPQQDPQQPPLAPAAISSMQEDPGTPTAAAAAGVESFAAAGGAVGHPAGAVGSATQVLGTASSSPPGVQHSPAASGAAAGSRPGTATIHPGRGDVTPDLAERYDLTAAGNRQ